MFWWGFLFFNLNIYVTTVNIRVLLNSAFGLALI